MVRAVLLSAVGALAIVSTPLSAAVHVFKTGLQGTEEVPPNASPGVGGAQVIFDDVTNRMRVIASFSGLTGNTVAAHIHCCAPRGSNAGVATPVPSFPGFPLGVTAGSYNQVFDLTQASSFNPAFVTNNGGTVASARAVFLTGLFAGQTYFNVHTTAFPGGEIRGNLFAAEVPEPESWALMIMGFGMAGFFLRTTARRAAPT